MTVPGRRRAAGPGRETRAEASGWRAAAAVLSLSAGHEEPASTPTLPLCQVCHPDTALNLHNPLPENLHDTVSHSICLTGCGVLI